MSDPARPPTVPAESPAPTPAGRTYGLIAEYASPADLLRAAQKVREAGFARWDVFTPFPVRGMDQAMGLKPSKVGWFAFVGCVVGYAGGMLMIWFMNARDYPLVVGGKPMFSPFGALPPSYELAILFGALGALGGMLVLNRLPRLHHPLLKHRRFIERGATHDRFFLVIEAADPKYHPKATRELLESIGGRHVEEVRE